MNNNLYIILQLTNLNARITYSNKEQVPIKPEAHEKFSHYFYEVKKQQYWSEVPLRALCGLQTEKKRKWRAWGGGLGLQVRGAGSGVGIVREQGMKVKGRRLELWRFSDLHEQIMKTRRRHFWDGVRFLIIVEGGDCFEDFGLDLTWKVTK